MRKFTSYGSPDPRLHYYAPREQLIETAFNQIIGDDPETGGHYVTVWAPRQTGKSWTMLEVMKKIWRRDDFHAGIITMQSAREENTDEGVLDVLVAGLRNSFEIDLPNIHAWKQISSLFRREFFSKPLILFLNEQDLKYETSHVDKTTGVRVTPIFVETGAYDPDGIMIHSVRALAIFLAGQFRGDYSI